MAHKHDARTFMNRDERIDADKSMERDANPDPITGSPGAHPVGTGVGAATGAAAGAAGTAAVGAAAGTAVGPIGTVVGGAVGAVVGGLAGKAVAEQVNPTEEESYWRENYQNEPFYRSNYTYEDYQPGYRTGYEGYSRYAATGRGFDEIETELRGDYERNRGQSRLGWEEAKAAARAAWDRIDRRRLESYINWEVWDKRDNRIGTLECVWSDTRGEAAFIGVKTGWFFGKTHVVPANNVSINEHRQVLRIPYDEDVVKNAPAYDSDAEMTHEKEQELVNYYGVQAVRTSDKSEETGMKGGMPQAAEAQTQNLAGSERPETLRPPVEKPTPEQATIQLSEEQLRVSKRAVEAGGVRLRKIVRTEVVNQPVELKREEIVIERVPPGEAHAGRQEAFNEQEVFIPLRREEATVGKETVMREEVRVRKHQRTDRQDVSETVRREDLEVENTGEARTTHRGGAGGGRSGARAGGGGAAEEIREHEETPRSRRRREQ